MKFQKFTKKWKQSLDVVHMDSHTLCGQHKKDFVVNDISVEFS